MHDDAEVVDRRQGRSGELVLRRAGDDFELVEDGVFLMDTRDGRSERLLATAALAAVGRPSRVLVGGLGMGITLQQVLTDDRVEAVDVVELEPVVVAWHREHLAHRAGAALTDPRTRVVVDDLVQVLQRASDASYDVLCLDVDNGPDWLATPSNAWLYGDAGLAAVRRVLRPGGAAAVWSAGPAPDLEVAMATVLDDVRHETAPTRFEHDRGLPDHVYLGRRPSAPHDSAEGA